MKAGFDVEGEDMRELAAFVMLIAALAAPTPVKTGRCFLLAETGVGELRRRPATTCSARVAPQSTFKVPHALAALDSGVITGVDQVLKYDSHAVDFEAWGRDHTLATAMRFSVLWYFQEIAKKLGAAREREYLTRFNYGNHDPSSGLTTFWLGGSLAISPEEQLRFVNDLFADRLPADKRAMRSVREILVQPAGVVVNAAGEHPFAKPWPAGTVVSAKTGAGSTGDGHIVRWLIGHVQRGSHAWTFVSNVVGGTDTPANAAIDQAAQALVEEHVLR